MNEPITQLFGAPELELRAAVERIEREFIGLRGEVRELRERLEHALADRDMWREAAEEAWAQVRQLASGR